MADEVWYEEAPLIEKIANETVIPEWHPYLKYLPILYVFVSKLPKKDGRLMLCKTKKLMPFERFLGGEKHNYVVMVAREEWTNLNEKQQIALLDHELSHIQRDANAESGYVMRGHDIEEFIGVVERHGAWKSDVRRFLTAIRDAQLDLFDPSMNGAATAATTGD